MVGRGACVSSIIVIAAVAFTAVGGASCYVPLGCWEPLQNLVRNFGSQEVSGPGV